MTMSSTSYPPDSSNLAHAVFPTQGLRVGDGKRTQAADGEVTKVTAMGPLPEEGAEKTTPQDDASAAPAAAPAVTEPPLSAAPAASEAQASFAFIEAEQSAPRWERPNAGAGLGGIAAPAVRPPWPSPALSLKEAQAEAGGPLGVPGADPDAHGLETSPPTMGAAPNFAPDGAEAPESTGAAPRLAEEGADASFFPHPAPEDVGPSLSGAEPPARISAIAVDAEMGNEAAAPVDGYSPEEEATPEHLARERALAAAGDEEEPFTPARPATEAPFDADANGVMAETAEEGMASLTAEGALPIDLSKEHALQAPDHEARTLEVPFALPAAEQAGPAPARLTQALDTAAKLAMDADAAAEALDSLKRLLAQGLPTSATAPPSPLATVAPKPVARVPLPPRRPPMAPPTSRANPLVESRPPPGERAHFDLRGFLAGFALSWAIGIVLYLFMTAG
jgi:hypothetical protein